jgi:hypothetical protein
MRHIKTMPSLSSISSAAEIGAVIFTLLAALSGIIFIFTSRPLRKREAHEKLVLQAQVASALKDAGTANERAGIANQRAGDAQERAENIARDNVRLRGEFEKSVADAKLTEARLREQNLNTEARLEQERRQRQELEQFLQPREIGVITVGKEQNIDFIKPLAGTRVIIECVAEGEPKRAAGELAFVLSQAGLKVEDVRPTIGGTFEDGVIITTRFVSPKVSREGWEESGKEFFAAIKLSEFLEASDWEADIRSVKELPNIPPGVIKISIGMKPNTYFMPAPMKQASKLRRDANKELRQHFIDLRKRALGEE